MWKGLKIKIYTNKGCWLWLNSKSPNGYGNFRYQSSHRYIYELSKGRVKNGYDLDHLCRNRICCNPNHLEEVMREENSFRGKKSRLTKKIVLEMRNLYKTEKVSNISEEYNIPYSTAHAAITGITWKNIDNKTIRKQIKSEFRRKFAWLAKKSNFTGILFRILDDKSFDEIIWKKIKPRHEQPFKTEK